MRRRPATCRKRTDAVSLRREQPRVDPAAETLGGVGWSRRFAERARGDAAEKTEILAAGGGLEEASLQWLESAEAHLLVASPDASNGPRARMRRRCRR